ncbi:LacI family DNA-binding transcriptional regulator [Pollutimonas sp. M17]|uniref:LacI family DNA-binding transcriptional regulator n=1 Tax=Pollutimonas sp. M17 TaxID=2962065 RepID=UPI0021F486A9|nr:LacI family DNA-binding transcriptional regulator [Pollutimonas sp. M17]UYO94811.1 LacI family DNA-binding transcriptional regulator [Pollutimonas sp. M17]
MVQKKSSIADVARLSGVSPGSVSRALSGKNWVSEDLRRRVEEAARQLNYSPNALARSLKTKQTHTIGAIVSDMSNPLHGIFLSNVQEELESQGYFLLVANSRNRAQRDCALLDLFSRGRVDGIIAAISDETDEQTMGILRSLKLPLVFHDREVGDIGDAVGPEHRTGAYQVTQYLVSLGHRRIGLMTPPNVARPGRERLAGYVKALEEANIPYEASLVRMLDATGGERAFEEAKAMLRSPHRPTAIICLGTGVLAGVIAASDLLGLSIPSGLSIVGIGDTELVRLNKPPITALRWDIAKCGRLAAQIMIERLREDASNRTPIRMVEVPMDIILRGSCAAPASS